MPDPIADIVSDAADQMRPSAAADDLIAAAESSGPAAPAAAPEGPEGFDPAVHVAGPDGSPVLNADGSYRKKPGRKNRGNDGKFASSSPARPAATFDAPPADEPLIDGGGAALVDRAAAHAAALQTVALVITLGAMVGGAEEWRPVTAGDAATRVDEHEMLVSAWEEYYVASGATDMPPGIGVAVAMGVYIVPRLTKPKTQSRLAAILATVRGWFRRG